MTTDWLDTQPMWRRIDVTDERAFEVRMQVPDHLLTDRLRQYAESPNHVVVFTTSQNGDATTDDQGVQWANQTYLRRSEVEPWTRPAADAPFGENHLYELISIAWVQQPAWPSKIAKAIVEQVLTGFAAKLMAGEEPPMFRDVIRRAWREFSYGPTRARWQAMEQRIRDAVAGGWKIDMWPVDRDRLTAKVASGNQLRDLRTALDREKAEDKGYLNLAAASTAVKERMNHYHKFDLVDYADLRELLRKYFRIGDVDVPADIAEITDIEQVKKLLAVERAQTEFGLEILYKEADRRNWCSDYDRIMRQAGWPGRPKNWTITFNVSGTMPVDAAWLKSMVGGEFVVEGSITRPWTNSFNLTMRGVDQPSSDEAMAKLRAEAEAYIASRPRDYTGADLATLKVEHVYD